MRRCTVGIWNHQMHCNVTPTRVESVYEESKTRHNLDMHKWVTQQNINQQVILIEKRENRQN